jgi:hypothetical protein
MAGLNPEQKLQGLTQLELQEMVVSRIFFLLRIITDQTFLIK